MHSEIRPRLSEYLERDLDPDERSRVDAHLGACSNCRRELSELRETVLLLRRLPAPVHPPALADAVMARIARESNRPARVRSLFSRIGEPRIALSLAAGLAGFFLMLQPADRSPMTGPAGSVVVARTPVPQPEWPGLTAMPERGPRAGVVSGATPAGIYAAYARRAQETARQLRGAGHPFSESLAAHLEGKSNIALADWQPR